MGQDEEGRDLLDDLVRIARDEIEDWRSFRDNVDLFMDTELDLPGKRLTNAVLQTRNELRNTRSTDGSQQQVGDQDRDTWLKPGEMMGNLLSAARSMVGEFHYMQYLQSQLTDEELTLLQEMISFDYTQRDTAAVATIFGVAMKPVQHKYHLKMRCAKNWVLRAHEAIVTYSTKLEFKNVGIGVTQADGAAKSLADATRGFLKETADSIKGSLSKESVNEPAYQEIEGTMTGGTNQFWLPSWFETGIHQGEAKAEGGIKTPLGKLAKVSSTPFTFVFFEHNGRTIGFNLEGPKFAEIYGKLVKEIGDIIAEELKKGEADANLAKRLVTPEAEFDIGLNYRYGIMPTAMPYNQDSKGADDPVPYDPAENRRWVQFALTDLFYATRKSELSPQNLSYIGELMKTIQRAQKIDPGQIMRFTCMGRASKIWRGTLEPGETAEQKNYDLAVERARTAQETFRELRRGILGSDNEGLEEISKIISLGTEAMALGDTREQLEVSPDPVREGLGSRNNSALERDVTVMTELKQDAAMADAIEDVQEEREAKTHPAASSTTTATDSSTEENATGEEILKAKAMAKAQEVVAGLFGFG